MIILKKSIRIIATGFFVIIFIAQVGLFLIFSDMNNSSEVGMSIRGTDIIIFIGDGVAEEELTSVKTYLQNWKGVISIAGVQNETTLLNGSIFHADFLIGDIYNISFFDAIFIPGGEHFQTLISHPMVIDLLQTANTNERVIVGLNEGTLVLAEAGLIDGRKFTTHSSIVTNLTNAGGIYVEGTNVVTDGNIITAKPPNYNELSYAIGNALGYSYSLETDIHFKKEETGWNYSVTIESNDKFIVEEISINLSRVGEGNQKILIQMINLTKDNNGVFSTTLGILPNSEYLIDTRVTSLYGNVEFHPDISRFSIGGN